MDADPAEALFGENADLYGELGVESAATTDAIKKAYRRLALLTHPDKLSASATEAQREATVNRFQRVSFAYTVLSDETRRARFDKTGRTDESMFGEGKDAAEWADYFAELWQGEVNASTIDDFYARYVGASRRAGTPADAAGSDEELEDLIEAYTAASGSLEKILMAVPSPDEAAAEDRFVQRINEAIDAGKLQRLSGWTKSSKDTKAREKRRKHAAAEAAEAEKAAQELGVHDKLYGGGKKGKSKKSAAGGTEDDLKALIQQRQAGRLDALVQSLESKYGAADEDEDEPPAKKVRRADSPD